MKKQGILYEVVLPTKNCYKRGKNMKLTLKKHPEIYDIGITTDRDYPDKVEIHLLDQNGAIVEGGQFDLAMFLEHVMQFYHAHY